MFSNMLVLDVFSFHICLPQRQWLSTSTTLKAAALDFSCTLRKIQMSFGYVSDRGHHHSIN